MHWSFFLLNDDTKCLVWWVNNRNTEAKKARPKIMCFLRMAGNHLKRCAWMRWSFSILNDDTKCLVWWVNKRNTEAQKTRPKIMQFKRMAGNHPGASAWACAQTREFQPGQQQNLRIPTRFAGNHQEFPPGSQEFSPGLREFPPETDKPGPKDGEGREGNSRGTLTALYNPRGVGG